jgi:hypothetical protein
MTDDLRCCGSGTCIINAEGFCWCGQQWDGEKMCNAPLASARQADSQAKQPPTDLDTGSDTTNR